MDNENQEGYFVVYKRIIHRLRDMILEVNPEYPYPSSLASTIIEASLHQHFLKDHFVSITDCGNTVTPTDFLMNLVLNTISS